MIAMGENVVRIRFAFAKESHDTNVPYRRVQVWGKLKM
jgi:hypothetical protein